MPHWGRPSRGQQKKKWTGRRHVTRRGEYDRFEEVDSDDDYGYDVDLRPFVHQRQFTGDELHFTGMDLGLLSRRNDSSGYDDESVSSEYELENTIDVRDNAQLQVAMRDKEQLLVRNALDRIRRAQMLGRSNVRLTQSELDALDRKRLRARAGEEFRDKRFASTGSGSGRDGRFDRIGRALKSRNAASPKMSRRQSRASLAQHDQDSAQFSTEAASPGFLVSGSDGVRVYTPFDARTSPVAFSPGSSPKISSLSARPHNNKHYQRTSASRQNQPHHHQEPLYSLVREGDHSAVPAESSSSRDSPRPLPDDPAWMPRVRSASSVQAQVVDPFQYQTYSPPALQEGSSYMQERRNVSGPPDVQYSSVRRVPTNPYVANVRMRASSSDPALSHLPPLGGRGEDDASQRDDDYDFIGSERELRADENYHSEIRPSRSGGGGERHRKGRR